MNRRRFLDAIAALAGIGQSLALPTAVSDARLVTRKQFLMGTVFEVLSYADSHERAARVIDQALAEVRRLEKVFSCFDADSEVSRLAGRRCSSPCRLSPDLYRIIERSLDFSRLSGGRFDVTVGPLTRLSREIEEEGGSGPRRDLNAARRSVGYRNLVLIPPDSLVSHADHLEIDLGAIGKGFAVDRAAELLLAGGLKHSLINAGRSSILALGAPPEESGWRIQLKDAGREIRLCGQAMSTSSQPNVPGMKHGPPKGHILDPLTGQPAEFGVSVSIICGSATTADALSTTCLLLGYQESCLTLKEFKDLTMIWTAADGLSRTFRTEP